MPSPKAPEKSTLVFVIRYFPPSLLSFWDSERLCMWKQVESQRDSAHGCHIRTLKSFDLKTVWDESVRVLRFRCAGSCKICVGNTLKKYIASFHQLELMRTPETNGQIDTNPERQV